LIRIAIHSRSRRRSYGRGTTRSAAHDARAIPAALEAVCRIQHHCRGSRQPADSRKQQPPTTSRRLCATLL
jgi:hypothetical protein